MASLEELLAEDGFTRRSRAGVEHRRAPKLKSRNSFKLEVCRDTSTVLRESRPVPGAVELLNTGKSENNSNNLLLCHRQSPEIVEYRKQSSRTTENTEAESSAAGRSSYGKVNSLAIIQSTQDIDPNRQENIQNQAPLTALSKETAIDEAAIRAVIKMLCAFCIRFIKSKDLRETLREKFAASLGVEEWKSQRYAEQAVIANLDWGIDGVEAAIATATESDGVPTSKEAIAATLRNATRMLSVAASLDVENLKEGSTCGVRNAGLAACAHLYLSIVSKLQKNDRIAAIHLLQVFIVSPSQGRQIFCKEIWDNVFLPHLLHIKVWYNEQYDKIDGGYGENSRNPERSRKLKKLRKVYTEQLDEGTRQFAVYYKEWLLIGVKARDTPRVKPPLTPRYQIGPGKGGSALGRRTEDSTSSTVGRPPLRQSLLEAVFDTPRRTETFDETTFGIAEKSKTISSMHDTRERDVVANVKGYSYMNEFPTVLEAEELDGRPSDHQLESGSSHMKEVSTGTAGINEAKGTEETVLASGIFLEEKELKEEELLKLWDHTSNICTFSEKYFIVSKLSNREGNKLTLKELAEVVSCLKQSKTFTNSYSPLSPLSSSEMNQPASDSEIESELTQCTNLGEECAGENDTITACNNPVTNNAGLQPENDAYFRHSCNIRIPKDFICPLTGQLFEDPVTLETGQTYERAAIQEWLDHGNTTCPITGQKLENLNLSSTNSIINEAVDAWKKVHYGVFTELDRNNTQFERNVSFQCGSENRVDFGSPAEESPKEISRKLNVYSNEETSSRNRFLTRRFSQVEKGSLDYTPSISRDILSELKQATAVLCTSNRLIECEEAALIIARVWQDWNSNAIVEASLSKAAIIDELMEVLSSSDNEDVLRKIVCILADLSVKNDLNRKIILRADSDLEIVMRVMKSNILPHSVILLHLLKPPPSKLVSLDLIPLLLAVTKNISILESMRLVRCTPQEAAILLLEQLLNLPDHTRSRENAKQVISLEGIAFLLSRLEFGSVEEKISIASVFCCCMQADGNVRHILIDNIKKANILELLQCNQGMSRTVVITFLIELLFVNRRALITKFLSELQKEGLLNTMHILLAYLQTASLEQQPVAATLLLQLDLLVQPRRYSVHREEALEAIVAALHCEMDKKAQLQAAKALLILGGRFSYVGHTLLEAWLLKKAGLENDLIDSMKEEEGPFEDAVKKWRDETKASDDWERKIASVLLTKGKSLFEGLAKSLSSRIPELARPCLVASAWLSLALASMPDTGMQLDACSILLPKLVGCLRHDKQVEERILAAISLHSYMQNPECLQLVSKFSREIIGPLQRLKWVTWTAKKLLDVVANQPFLRTHTDIFVHGEVAQMDASENGRTEALAYGKRKLYTGHSDGTIKVWNVKNHHPKLMTEVKKHKSSVTCLAISQSSDRLFSGSTDKSIRVWKLGSEDLVCMQLVQTRGVVRKIAVNAFLTFFVSEGYGVKALDNFGMEKILNSNRQVQGFAVAETNVYCGCSDWSIQEVDLRSGEVMSLQTGHSKLAGKQATVYELQVFKDCLYTAGNSTGGVSTQVWNLKNKNLTATISTTTDVIAMVVNEDFIYLGCNASTGLIEVWLREKLQKVTMICIESRISALAFGEDVLYSASEDGKIQAWAPV